MTCPDVEVTVRPAGNCGGGSDQGGKQTGRDSVGIKPAWSSGWKIHTGKGVANQPGPEPCEGSREVALEALDRGICGRDIELRNLRIRERTVSSKPERNNAMRDNASAARPCGVEDPTHA